MIKLASYFTGFSSKSDGSASLRFNTQEITPEDFAELKKHHNAFGYLLFAEQVSSSDIPSEKIEEEGISSSERLRRRMFVYWKSKGIGGDFETWRKQKLESYGQKMLDALQ